ncbi:MAG: hypothetical protein QNJ41_30025 [Xenococcaceae cyanobacterium MO_188.B32]|nr:hypothetical protein [Xenococcaceae cyanobacterium MO_188.B32]
MKYNLRSRRENCDRDGKTAIETGELRSRRENCDRDGKTKSATARNFD